MSGTEYQPGTLYRLARPGRLTWWEAAPAGGSVGASRVLPAGAVLECVGVGPGGDGLRFPRFRPADEPQHRAAELSPGSYGWPSADLLEPL